MEIEQQLRWALMSGEPGRDAEDAVMARVSAAAWRASQVARRRRSRPLIVTGVVLFLAAAAAMLAVRQVRMPTTGPVAATAPASAPQQVAAMVDPPAPIVLAPEPAATSPAPSVRQPAPRKVAPTSGPFTVSVQPLRNEAKDAAARAAVDLFFATLLDGLRAVPGLTLVETDADDSAQADYKLMIMGSGPMAGNKFNVSVAESVIRLPDGSLGASSASSAGGDIAACPSAIAPAADQAPCLDPVHLAASVIRRLRQKMFPPDPSLQLEMQAQLVDSMRDPQRREQALKELSTLGQRNRATGKRMLDSATLSTAIRLATTTHDPAVRAGIWQALRGVGDMALLQPLITSLDGDADGEVRLQAAITLSADFADDARSRAALERAARADGRPLVRAIAQRAMTGDAGWNKYIVASLKDRSRPDVERVEALVLHLCPPGAMPTSCVYRYPEKSPTASVRELLDDEAIEALAQVLPRVSAKPPARHMLTVLISKLGTIERPAITTLMVDILGQNTDPTIRQYIVRNLALRKGEPAALAALEKTSATDGDPQLREIAAQALKPTTPAEPPAK